MPMTTTPDLTEDLTDDSTESGPCEHEMLPSDESYDWVMSQYFALRAVDATMRQLNQSAQDLAYEVRHHEETFLACVAALKMLQAEEKSALRRAGFAARACEALTQAIAARNDPRTPALMEVEIDYAHVPALSKTNWSLANLVRVDPDSGRASLR